MDNVLIDRSASGFDFRRWTDAVDDGCRDGITMSMLPPRTGSIYGSIPYLPSSTRRTCNLCPPSLRCLLATRQLSSCSRW
jgi:hypothetical protein